jgi:cation diffusion facilitator family transporter
MLLIRAGRRHGSIALEADGKHLLTDAVTTLAAIVSLALVALSGRGVFDPLGALVIAVYISIMAIGVLRRATAGLMDEQDVEDDRLIRSILDAHLADGGGGAGAPAREPMICSYHKLRHRHSGRYHWVDFHILVPAGWNVQRGHEVASKLEHEIEQALGEGNATAHVEPCHDVKCSRCASHARQAHEQR